VGDLLEVHLEGVSDRTDLSVPAVSGALGAVVQLHFCC
jgi:hypothetical protein